MRLAALILAAGLPLAAQTVKVVFETEMGAIELAVNVQQAPATSSNFLAYVDAGHYDGGMFHRTVKPDNQPRNQAKIEVIQGGPNAQKRATERPPIRLERTSQTGLKHLNGTLSMARAGVDSATSDIFICVGAQPELDFGGKRNPDGQGFAAFGEVTAGLDVVKKIQQAPAEGQTLQPPVRIVRAYRLQ